MIGLLEFVEFSGGRNPKYNANITEKGLYASQHQDRDFYLDKLSFIKIVLASLCIL